VVVGGRDYGGGVALEILDDVQPQTIPTAIGSLLASPERRMEMSKRGRAVVEDRFGADSIGRRYRAFAAELRTLPCR